MGDRGNYFLVVYYFEEFLCCVTQHKFYHNLANQYASVIVTAGANKPLSMRIMVIGKYFIFNNSSRGLFDNIH